MKKPVSSEMIAVISVVALGVLSMSILSPILPLYLTDIDVSPEMLGLMFSVGMIGMLLGEGFWGWAADKVGLKVPLSMGTFACALTVLFFVFTQKVPAIFLIFFFWGIFRSALFGPGKGYVGANAPITKKATFMAILAAMMAASRSIGALPGGFVADNWGYQWVFFIACGTAFLGGITMLAGIRKTRPEEKQLTVVATFSMNEPSSSAMKPDYRIFAILCIITIFHFWGMGVIIAFLPLLANQVVGVTITEVGVLFTIRGFVAVVLGIPTGMLADQVGKKTFMIFGLLVSGAAMAGMAFAESYSQLIGFVVASSLGFVMFSPAALGVLSDSMPLKRQSTAMGFYGALGENTGIIAGSSLAGFIWSTWGPQATFLMGTTAASMGAVICFFGLARKRAFSRSYHS